MNKMFSINLYFDIISFTKFCLVSTKFYHTPPPLLLRNWTLRWVVLLFKGAKPPGRSPATCVNGAPPAPNHHAHQVVGTRPI